MDYKNHGRSLELFFINGRPDGMLTAEVFVWTGHILAAPRTQIGEALKRPASMYTGVYVLIGETEDGAKLYVGEGEDISQRIKSHDTNKDWWTKAILITSAANNLNKAHVKYLESRLVEEANKVGQSIVDNGNAPTKPSLSEAAQANMESFLQNILMVMPAIGIDSFLQKTRPKKDRSSSSHKDEAETVFEVHSTRIGLRAEAVLKNGEFIVQEGSEARSEWQSDRKHGYSKLFEKLVDSGVMKLEGKVRVFQSDYAFASPSASAAIIFGRPSNGQTEWKLKGTKKTYKQWEAEEIEKAV
ncbi:GIY-YIG nuclease family protein [Litorimonas sp. WD9-15]|uniref:GIY-YIG nuclease family protein n=1 Tax=Litorimonas sp. WD9-15 TaxID=3418716 RepID=UPI003CFEA13F